MSEPWYEPPFPHGYVWTSFKVCKMSIKIHVLREHWKERCKELFSPVMALWQPHFLHAYVLDFFKGK